MGNPLDITVSRFRNYESPGQPKDINLLEWLISEEFRPQIEELRILEYKDSRDAIKRTLPGVTVSGRFNYRSNGNLIEHSGLICLDIDRKDNPHIGDFEALKWEFAKISNVAFCGLSASGRRHGLYCIIPIAHPERHGQHFDALRNVFLKRDITLDKNCRDLSRLRGASWDEKPYINPNPIVYTGLYQPPRQTPKYYFQNLCGDVGKDVQRLVDEIDFQQIDITDDYQQWLRLGFAVASEFGEAGRGFFHRISQHSTQYNEHKCDKQYSACLKSRGEGVTIATFFKICTDHGLILNEH